MMNSGETIGLFDRDGVAIGRRKKRIEGLKRNAASIRETRHIAILLAEALGDDLHGLASVPDII
jgi:hypothetical protein